MGPSGPRSLNLSNPVANHLYTDDADFRRLGVASP
jgi:hypothetical protein